jgi:pectate lyase
VTISNCEIDGSSTWSATCDGHHYWAVYLTGSNDMVTMKGNYIHHTSGRSPKVGGNTLLHAVNNYWYANSGHAFEVGTGASIVAEGNVFQNVANPVSTLKSITILSHTNEVLDRCRYFWRPDLHCFFWWFGLLVWSGPRLPDQRFRQLR